MKHIIWLWVLVISISACNNDHKEHSKGKETPKSSADSLMAEIMDGHDVGMAKYGKLRSMKSRVDQVLDSISNLPASAKKQLGIYRDQLQIVGEELTTALNEMDKWMEEFNMDSAIDNVEQRINYLSNEKLKVGKVKESILKSLQDADSVLKSKF